MQKGMTTPLIIAGVVLLVLAGGYFLMRGNDQTDTMETDTMMEGSDNAMMEDGTMAPEESGMADDSMMMEEGVVNVTIEAGNFYFSPDTIEAKVGDTVRVTMNAQGMPHDFDIDEFNVDTEPIEGESTTFEFVVDQAGEFEYYCSVGQHRANGMYGTLIVTE